jgi:hypothetical protein
MFIKAIRYMSVRPMNDNVSLMAFVKAGPFLIRENLKVERIKNGKVLFCKIAGSIDAVAHLLLLALSSCVCRGCREKHTSQLIMLSLIPVRYAWMRSCANGLVPARGPSQCDDLVKRSRATILIE